MSKYDFFGAEFAGFPKFTGFPFDFSELLEVQRKNLQALTEAQQLALEGYQTAAQRQAEILSRAVQEQSALAQEVMAEGTPEQKVARQTDLFRKSYESSVANWNELADLIRDSNREAAEIINKRVTASLGEIKSAIEKNGAASNSNTQKKAA